MLRDPGITILHVDLVNFDGTTELPDIDITGDPALGGPNIFDTTGFDTWTVYVTVLSTLTQPLLTFSWWPTPRDVSPSGLASHSSFFLPATVPPPLISPETYAISGRCQGAICAVTLSTQDPLTCELAIALHNRPTRYAGPHMSAPYPQPVTGAIPFQEIANGSRVVIEIPYYIGPATISARIPAAGTVVDIYTAPDPAVPGAGNIFLFNAINTTTPPQADLWLPGIQPLYLRAQNNSGAPQNMAATLTATN